MLALKGMANNTSTLPVFPGFYILLYAIQILTAIIYISLLELCLWFEADEDIVKYM